jgi:nitrous oxidase accessory protein
VSHPDPGQTPPVPLVERFLAAVAVRAAPRLWILLTGLAMLLVLLPAQAQNPPGTGLASLQPLIDQAKPGDVLTPEPGTYAGPLVIDKALTLDGRDQVVIDGGGKGTIILLKTDGATLRNLRLTHSGDSHNDIDSGIQVRGNFNVIKDNVIDHCLFGVDLQQSNNNIVRRNRISSKPVELGSPRRCHSLLVQLQKSGHG